MKAKHFFRIIFLFTFSVIWITACEKEEDTIWGDVNIGFSVLDEEELTAPAEAEFINQSKHAESYHWVFPGGRIMERGEITGDSVTTDIQPDQVYYAFPGDYHATLTITADGEEQTYTHDFTVEKPQPQITHEPSGIVYDDTVTFSVEFFEYPELQDEVTYNWDLGNGETSEEANPSTTYNPPGEYTVSVEVFDGIETLHASLDINVQAEVAKTLYFTNALDQSIYKKMLYSDTDLPHEDVQIDVGLHPLSLSVHEQRLVITVAGDDITWSPEDTPADGNIFTTNLEGGNRWTITAPGPLPDHDYRDDPFVGTVGPDGTIYWLDRFQGARQIHYTEQDADYPEPYIFDQASEGSELAEAIGVVSAYGWTDGAIRIVDGEIWYSKHGSGRGLYRFTMEGDYIDKFENLFDLKIRTFDVDLENERIYFAVNMEAGGYEPGLYYSDINGQNIQLIDPLENFSMQGGETERTFVTEIVVDAEGGYVYYPFRHTEDIDIHGDITGDGSLSGIKRWKMDGSEEPEFYVTGVLPYGIGIDHVKR